MQAATLHTCIHTQNTPTSMRQYLHWLDHDKPMHEALSKRPTLLEHMMPAVPPTISHALNTLAQGCLACTYLCAAGRHSKGAAHEHTSTRTQRVCM